MKDIKVILEELKDIIEEKMSTDSQSWMNDIQFCINYFELMKKNYKQGSDNNWFYFEKDEYLESKNIEQIIFEIVEKIKNKFGSHIIDELAIIKFNWSTVVPIYFYSLNKERLSPENQLNLKQSIIDDLKFYTWNILQDDLLEDWEWTLAWNQTWSSFDIILRIWDYIFGFNNSQLSIDEIQKQLGINKNDLIAEVSKLYNYFK